jgi:hypothetical protein
MAIVSVIAVVLAMCIAAGATSRPTRVGVAATLVPLVSALALTGSRAAAAALAAGVAAVIVLEPERGRMLAVWRWILVVPTAAALAVSAFTPTDSGIVGSAGDELGNRLLVLLVALTAVAVLPAVLATRSGWSPERRRLRRFGTSLGAVALACLIGLGITSFPSVGGDRPLFWRVALEEFGERPLLGSGAGTYAQVWLERRPADIPVRDAHSILVEALAELGLVGAGLVVVLLTMPLVWARRGRTRPLVPAAGGAFAAYAVHASADWDWEMPAITLAGLFCAVGLGVAADLDRPSVRLSTRARHVAVAAAALVALAAFAGLVGATALENARRDLARGDAAAAAREAARATFWQPWSAEGLLVGGQARLGLGDRSAARTLFARAAAQEPADYRTWLALAAVSRPDLAEAAVRRAGALNPRALQALPRLSSRGVPDSTTDGQREEER